MKILWMTSLRPIGKSKENDNIQDLFIKSVTNLKSEVKFSFTQFDDNGVEDYIKSNNLNAIYNNIKKNSLPENKKYSNKLMLDNALNQFIDEDFDFLVYSTADILIPSYIFKYVEEMNIYKSDKEFCVLVYPNILQKNGIVKSVTFPHYGIDIFIFKINKHTAKKFKNSIIHWNQYDWGINDNFYVSICDLLDLPIYNIYKNVSIIKFENDFKTINESRNWQISSWKENKKYFMNFLKKNKLSIFYAHGSYYYLLYKIFRFRDFNLNLFLVYFKFYLFFPINFIKKLIKKIIQKDS